MTIHKVLMITLTFEILLLIYFNCLMMNHKLLTQFHIYDKNDLYRNLDFYAVLFGGFSVLLFQSNSSVIRNFKGRKKWIMQK
jgi:hypothetical protein